ncbi:MAG: TatD family deoxyribonuclease [Actinobacteria bacterium HGW-Actinobacteria-1]|jgi:TatD DNase family protein|nr:MAG: TatD family deoxyribonuclease [Actinobacteria bacterium HGW-Actinobacteria-1]
MTSLPPLDLHAHVNVDIDPLDLRALHSVVFAVTRSLEEAERAVCRSDDATVWGVGAHPSLCSAVNDFSPQVFSRLVKRTAFVGELGLDAKSRVPMVRQRDTLREALAVLAEQPRITSVHSYGACEHVLDEVEAAGVQGIVLHWWLGDEDATRRAIDLGCWFSVNPSQAENAERLRLLPVDRVLPETDHPFGDRRVRESRPGCTEAVEERISVVLSHPRDQLREKMWSNLQALVSATSTYSLLPRAVRARLATI